MMKGEVDWPVFDGETNIGAPVADPEWYGLQMAERGLSSDVSHVDLIDMCLYLRGKILDDFRYEALANRAEILLLARMSGRYPGGVYLRRDSRFKHRSFRQTAVAMFADHLVHRHLIDIAEYAQSESRIEADGAKWGVLYDLAIVQILRRIKRTPGY